MSRAVLRKAPDDAGEGRGMGLGADLTVPARMAVLAGQSIADELGQLRRGVRQEVPTTDDALTECAAGERRDGGNRQGHGRRRFGISHRADGQQTGHSGQTRAAHPHITARSRFLLCLSWRRSFGFRAGFFFASLWASCSLDMVVFLDEG